MFYLDLDCALRPDEYLPLLVDSVGRVYRFKLSFFLVAQIVFGIPVILLLRQYNKFNRSNLILAGVIGGFIVGLLLAFSLNGGKIERGRPTKLIL